MRQSSVKPVMGTRKAWYSHMPKQSNKSHIEKIECASEVMARCIPRMDQILEDADGVRVVISLTDNAIPLVMGESDILLRELLKILRKKKLLGVRRCRKGEWVTQ